ncbi:hypothetical protein FACS189468_5960 [Spirochaetia bacterium]|nr:hypothetical protein FACS189468_5960 [Spirochaetia bacterium]
MLQMIFSIRFQSQLRRTRPTLLGNLETSIIQAIEAFGGTVRMEHKLIHASFDDKTLGFSLDILSALEDIIKALEKASSELYGHLCVLGADFSEEEIPLLTRNLPSDIWGTGIWCSVPVRTALESYIVFDEPLEGADYNPHIKGYAQIKSIKHDTAAASNLSNSEKIQQFLKEGGPQKSTVLIGPPYSGKRAGLYRYCMDHMDDFAPLLVRFGSGGNSINCLGDALTPVIRAILTEADSNQLDVLGEALSRERLRDEFSDFLIQKGRRFFPLLIDAYCIAAERRKIKPVLILENIQDADPTAQRIIMDTLADLPNRGKPLVYGTCSRQNKLESWEPLFLRIIKFSPEKRPDISKAAMSRELWEMAYACALFRRYFPGYLFSGLLVEAGKNAAMINRALGILLNRGIIDSVDDPCPQFSDFIRMAEAVLGEGVEKVRSVVRNRLLAWVEDDRLKPCFNLLKALSSLGGEGDDKLIMDTLSGDIINGTYRGIEEAIRKNRFAALVGETRLPSLLSIFRTQKALLHGGQEEIREAFMEPIPAETSFPGYKARIFANNASYCLGICDYSAAAASVKESLLITQSQHEDRFLAQIYRLFSLVDFSRQQLSDAIDYFAFAIEHAEKSEDYSELGLIAYYAAAAHFIFGNISKAERLARQAEEAALLAGRADWADRCRFLRGRLRFEIGRYQEALDIFKNLEANYIGSGGGFFKPTLAAWIYRSNIYLRNPGALNFRISGQEGDFSAGFDARLFEIEAAYLAGEYRQVLDLSNTLGNALSRDRFIYIEQPDWRSGFAQCELLLFPLRDLWDRMISTYRALALCQLDSTETFDREEASRDMQRVLRDELPDTDPNDAFYFYSCYRVLQKSGAPEVDMNTAISIAFKRLQRRASRIDDNETKRSFLSFHYWNGALAVAAKEHNLI